MFHKIDMETWPRREHYHYYQEKIRTCYQVNVEIDVTKVVKRCKKKGFRFYPVMLYAIMRAINNNQEFRMALDEEGALGYYDVCHPSYTIFHEDDKTFSDIWTNYDADFGRFYPAVVEDMEACKDRKGIKAKDGKPAACTPISCAPWIHYTSISHDTPGPNHVYFPIITFGKYEKKDGKWLLPFSVYVNHSIADGYHTSKLILEIQEHCRSCKTWMQ
jgi:chloramphenicol O-acetyltransferase type A